MITYERSWWWVKQRKQMALVFISVTMLLQFQIKGCVGCVETERIGLLQLKSYFNSLRSPHEGSILESWSDDDPKSDCCHWERVKCSEATGGHIFDLSLDELCWLPQSQGLNISLVHSFPRLKTLDFSANSFDHLFDPIHGHRSFQILENLETLDLSINYLNNSVLPFLSAARSLKILNLRRNMLEGVFPPNGLINFRELEELDLSANSINDFDAGEGLRMTKLKKLDLSFNKFSDSTRLKGLENLVELEVLNLGQNEFNHTRSIQVLRDMPQLQVLDLSSNKITDLDSLGLVFHSSLQVLILRNNQLSSTHQGYSKLCGLMDLRELDLRDNALTSMPNCLGNLSRLRTLDLSDNQLNGNLSAFVYGLPSALEYLALLDNNFNCSFLFNSLVNQTRLRVFEVSSKVGMIQAQAESLWVPLFQLEVLKLNNFILGSTFPGFLVYQHELCFIDLSNNKLTGAFPTWLVQNHTRLQTILFSNNLLTELQLPRVVHGLRVLDISNNRIYDSIQDDIGIVFPKMEFMDFSSNHFYGTIPSSMGEMKSLTKLDMSSNRLSGQLPKSFSSGLYSMEILKLSNNQFHGEIFMEDANLTSLRLLILDGNNFNGSLGKGLLNSKELMVLEMSDNSFSGTLPLWIGRMSNLWKLVMRGNQLKGPFPHQLQSLMILDISHNSFSGSIPRNLNFPYLRDFRLQNNEFMGLIPDALFKHETLLLLDLGNNNFSGKILTSVGKRCNLHILLLGNNNLQSHIPEKICRLSHITILDLSHNKFKGLIPSCLGNISFGAQRFDFNWIGHVFDDTKELVYFQIWNYTTDLYFLNNFESDFESRETTTVDFVTKNRNEAYQGGIFTHMYGLDLSNNELSGEIPVEIWDLQYIKSLNLSSNHLTGSIPDSISRLKELESLDLSNNKLDGNIPPVLADLNSLGSFNVSCNNFSGAIPFKGHLITFDERSYINNPHLCGLPTHIPCGLTIVPEPSASLQAKEEEDGVIDMVLFYWTCGAAYISTSLALFAFLCIDSRWSQEWFYRVDLFIHHLQCLKRSSFFN